MDRVIHKTECPDEARLLAFFENRLAYFGRRGIQRHLASCADCCDSLAFLVKGVNSGTLLDEVHPFELDANALRTQTASVLSLIESSEREERIRSSAAPSRSRRPALGFSYRMVAAAAAVIAVVISAYLLAGNYFSSAARADKMLAKAVKSSRKIELQMPGMEYSEVDHGQRVAKVSSFDNLEYDKALSEVSPNGEIPSERAAQFEMAKILVARDAGEEDAQKALTIVDGLLKTGPLTGELFNLRGMALYNLGESDPSKNDDAIEAFTSALQNSPDLMAAYFNRALVEKHMHRYQEAQHDLETYIPKQKDLGWLKAAKKLLLEVKGN